MESLCSSKDNRTPTKCDFMHANMVLRSDGSVVYLLPAAPDAGADYNAARAAQAQVPGTYRHGSDTLVVTSYPKKYRAAFIAAGGHAMGPPKDDAETTDMILKYRLDGDILETTWHLDDFTTVDKYVRVK